MVARPQPARTGGGAPQKQDRPTPRAQERLIGFLESPESYPHRANQVRALQTHISWVFIASPFVFKVKKPVNLGFLDFSTLEKRQHFCQREIELNRRLCPEIYLDAIPIYETDSGFSFKPPGKIVEYAVKMKELPHGWFLSELLEKDLVSEKEINRVISTLHCFYRSETSSPQIEQWGTPEKLKISTDENFAQVKPFVSKTISPVALETIRHFTNGFYVVNENLFRERIRRHRILDCHGDLHLDHVHLTPKATTIFDCIEFNDRFRFIDITNDLAFLAMDFDFHGRSDLGNLLLKNAAREFVDAGMPKVATFYKCYRAFVRGKVESIQATETETQNPSEHDRQAACYFRLALKYAVSGSEPILLVVMGRVATGKTSVAKQLGRELDWPVFSSDEIRKTLAGIPLKERTSEKQRGQVYSLRTTKRTYRELVKDGLAAIGHGQGRRPRLLQPHGGAILDATFSTHALRDFLRDECEKANVRLQAVELNVHPGEIKNRLKARDRSAGEISDARLEDFEKLGAAYEPPSELASDFIQITANNSVTESVKTVLLKLAEKQAR